MREHKNFWDKNAGRYDRFMRKDRAAYDEMYALIRPLVRHKTVLELATGTGLIAKHIVDAAAHIEATDASAEMIAKAKRDNQSAKLLLQRLPEGVKNVHYHDDETHIRQLLEKYDLMPRRGASLAAATVRGLILTVSHKEQIGELYPQVLETLVYGACRELFE